MTLDKLKLAVPLYFGTPIYEIHDSFWVDSLNKECDIYLNKIKSKTLKNLKHRNKVFNKDLKDHGIVYLSENITNNKKFDSIKEVILNNSSTILESQGYNLTKYRLIYTEFWVQEFGKNGGGHHDTHLHPNNHISGFYFLKASEKTSFPIFMDPRQGKLMTDLPLVNPQDMPLALDKVFYKPIPGKFIFFNSYVPHAFSVDNGVEPFRFIHFNIQAVLK
jgi:uncharacterized protein (TIGR02466 family)